MKFLQHCFVVFAFSLMVLGTSAGQTSSSSVSSLPHVIKYSGLLNDAEGKPRSGALGVVFSIYDKQDSVSPMWLEAQSVTADESGHYTVILGATSADGVPASIFTSGEARWIGVQTEGEAEQARTLLVSVPYALKAGDADTLGGKPLSAFLLADSASTTTSKRTAESSQAKQETTGTGDTGILNFLAKFSTTGANSPLISSAIVELANGNVGIGTASPGQKLEVNGNLSTGTSGTLFTNAINSNSGTFFINYSGGSGDTYFGRNGQLFIGANGNVGIGTSNPQQTLEVNGSLSTGASGTLLTNAINSNSGAFFINYSGGSGDTFFGRNGLLYVGPNGRIGIGNNSPTTTLDVSGIVRAASGFRFPDGTTQTTAALGGAGTLTGITTAAGSGLVGGGTTGSLNLGLITSCSANQILKWSGTAWACGADQTGAGGITYPYTSGAQSTASGAFTVTQSNTTVLAGDPTFAFATTSIPAAIVGVSSATTNTAAGVAAFSNSASAPALIAWNGSIVSDPNGDAQGIIGQTSNPTGTGVEGNAKATTGVNVGVKGGTKSPQGVGVQGDDGGAGGLAGLFNGKVQMNGQLFVPTITGVGNPVAINGGLNISSGGATVTGSVSIQGNLTVNGNISKTGGTFKIDHPLDPAGKYLYHSFVESSDMMNIYNGVVTLDAKGQAWITMPDWFEALNMDFRYQLTSIGRFAPVFIAKEITGNRFKISGGRAHGKVSWQVTGIRHDAWADAHRVQVEEVKAPAEQGTYISPELFTKPGSNKIATSDQPRR